MRLPTTTLEKKLLRNTYDLVCGVDEVGMGCLAGPVVVAAVSFHPDFYASKSLVPAGLRESKLLSAPQREKFEKELLKLRSLTYAVALSSPRRIDKINIYQASREAMRTAIKKVSSRGSGKVIVLVDGNKKIPGLKFEQQAIVKGDQKIFAIACASIIAKVYRDKLMKRYAKQFPAYGFEQHKGYSTKLHQKMLKKYGPISIHRRSFRLEY